MLHPGFILFHIFIWGAGLYEVNTKKKLSKGFMIFSALYLIFWAGFKYECGPDYLPYLRLFYTFQEPYFTFANIFSSDFQSHIETSYVIVCRTVYELGLEFHWVIIFYASLAISLKLFTMYKYSYYPFVSLMVYFMPLFFFEDMIQIRQGLAIGITFFSFKFILERKLFYFLICIFFAYSFHKTSIAFLPAYWIAPLRIKTPLAILLVFISMIIFPLNTHELIAPIVGGAGADTAFDAFNQYSEYNSVGFSAMGELVKLNFLILLFSFDKKGIEETDNYYYYRNLCLIYYMIYYAFRNNNIFAIRLPGSYQPFTYLMIPIIIRNASYQFKTIVVSYFFLYSILIHYRFASLSGRDFNIVNTKNILLHPYNYEFTRDEGY